MLRLIQLIYGSNPSRGSFDRAEIDSRRPLAQFFLNRISHTESIFYQQLAANQSFAGTTPRKILFFTNNPYVLNILSATSMQSIF
jgi:hypothetical protein